MGLSREQREALDDEDFAIPSKRLLPIVDDRHVRMAWSQVLQAKGLTDDDRRLGRDRIKARASSLGVDTSGWDRQSVSFVLEAMALDMPDVPGHPNRMPFSGILTRIDEPSDKAPHGSSGRRTVLPKAVAEAALPSLMGMGIDCTKNLDGHDAKAKIGVITEATIEGNAVHIAGFLYASDFPEECARIKAEKNRLGFSYELKASISDLKADPWVIDQCVFTGAAVLYKHLAAYTTTSLAAQADKGIEMTPEELKALLAEALKPIATQVADLGKEVTEIKASAKITAEKIEAAGAAHGVVKPHADALRACATGMSAAGIGGHAQMGHVKILNHMADKMEAESMMGNIPHIYRDNDFLHAAAAGGEGEPKADPKVAAQLKANADALEAASTKIKDLELKAAANATEPERKTLSPQITALLQKLDLTASAADGTLTVEMVDKTLNAQPNLSGAQRMETKLKLMASGALVVPKPA